MKWVIPGKFTLIEFTILSSSLKQHSLTDKGRGMSISEKKTFSFSVGVTLHVIKPSIPDVFKVTSYLLPNFLRFG